jgi:hypothetical protein
MLVGDIEVESDRRRMAFLHIIPPSLALIEQSIRLCAPFSPLQMIQTNIFFKC